MWQCQKNAAREDQVMRNARRHSTEVSQAKMAGQARKFRHCQSKGPSGDNTPCWPLDGPFVESYFRSVTRSLVSSLNGCR